MAKEIDKKKVNKTTKNNKNKDEIVVKKIDKKVSEENEEKDKKRKLIIIILLLLLLCIFGISVTFGKDVFGNISDQILEVLDLNKPTAPVITGGSEEWSKERLIKIEKDAKVKDTLSYYEYCIREEKSTKKCEWNKTETKNVKIVTTGKYYVTFRAVDNEGRVGKNSNTEVVYIDNNNPVIKDIKKEVTNNSIKIEVDAKDEHSGIKSYSYSLDGNIRDNADILHLVVLSNLEVINSDMIDRGISQSDRLEKLNQIAIKQLQILYGDNNIKKLESDE